MHQTTAIMSKQEMSKGGELVCLLPEMVSHLQKDLYFYAPDNTATIKNLQVNFRL